MTQSVAANPTPGSVIASLSSLAGVLARSLRHIGTVSASLRAFPPPCFLYALVQFCQEPTSGVFHAFVLSPILNHVHLPQTRRLVRLSRWSRHAQF